MVLRQVYIYVRFAICVLNGVCTTAKRKNKSAEKPLPIPVYKPLPKQAPKQMTRSKSMCARIEKFVQISLVGNRSSRSPNEKSKSKCNGRGWIQWERGSPTWRGSKNGATTNNLHSSGITSEGAQ